MNTKTIQVMKLKNLVIPAVVGLGIYWFTKAYTGFWSRLQFNFGGVKFGGIGADFKSIILRPALNVNNQNEFTIPVTGFQGWIYFQGEKFTPIQSISNTAINAKSETLLQYQLIIGWEHLQKLGENWKTAITGGNFRMIGDIEVTVSNIVYKFPINEPFAIEI